MSVSGVTRQGHDTPKPSFDSTHHLFLIRLSAGTPSSMRFPVDMFAKLPFSLLLTSLALATSALPVESVELLVLTPDNFDKTVADGVW